jgi:hypothetical protein
MRIRNSETPKFNEFITVFNIQVSQKWHTHGALRCRRDYRKRQKNVKKFYWTYLLIWQSLKCKIYGCRVVAAPHKKHQNDVNK